MQDLITVMWRPQRSFARLPELKVSWLIGAFFLIHLVLSLTIMNVYSDGVDKAMAANPAILPSMKPLMIGISMFFAATFPVLVIAISAIIFLLVVYVAGNRVSYRTVFGMLTLASAPMLVSQFLRNFCYIVGAIPDVMHSAVPLSLFLPGVGQGLVARALTAFDLFDLLAAALVTVGFHRISGLRRGPAYAIALVLWVLLQMLLFRLHVASTGGQ